MKKEYFWVYELIIFGTILYSCDTNDPAELSSVITTEVTEITKNTAKSGGNVMNDGGSPVTSRGVVWSTSEHPVTDKNDGVTKDGEGTGLFESSIRGLVPGTTYFVRAYAKNSAGTAYGDQISFTTLKPDDGTTGTLQDIDGNIYKTVYIDGREWTAENIHVTRYNDGEPVPAVYDDREWELTTSGAYSVYPFRSVDGFYSDEEILEAYGALYNWYAVETGRLCPSGWGVPTDEEWISLEGYADTRFEPDDPEWDRTDWRGYDAGQRLRAPYDFGFSLKNEHLYPVIGTNVFGFTAVAGGFRNFIGPYYDIGNYGYWWSSSERSDELAWMRSMGVISVIRREGPGKGLGFSVRCIRKVENNL